MLCGETGKQQLSRSEAKLKLIELAKWDASGYTSDTAPMNVYRCSHCHRHHVGHNRLAGDLRPARRLNV